MEITGDVISAANADIGSLQLGVGGLDVVFDRRGEVRQLTTALAVQAQRSLLLHTRDLEPVIYDQQPFLDAVRGMVGGHRDSCFYILLQDGRSAVQNGNRLIELARRLSSRIQIRRPPIEQRDFAKTFLLADDSGYLQRPFYDRYEGTASFNKPDMTRRLKQYFMEVWEHSLPDAETRRLHL